MKKYRLKESAIKRVVNKVLLENEMSKEIKEKKMSPKCIPENVVPLSEIVGYADEYGNYGNGISKRRSGVNSFVDTLEYT